MGFLSRFEGKMEDTVEGMASSLGGSSLSPVQITKKAEKQMRREKIVGAGAQYAPTLYTVLVSEEDDSRLFGYYPTLAGEVETYLMAKAAEIGLVMDGQPLVRFLADPELKRGKFDVVAEMVAAPIIARLRDEEMQRYGIAAPSSGGPRGSLRQSASRGSGVGVVGRASRGIVSSASPIRPALRPNVSPRPVPVQAVSPVQQPAAFVPQQQLQDDYNEQAYAQDYQDDAFADDSFDEDLYDEVLDTPKTTVMGAVEPKFSNNYSADIDVYLYDAARDRAYELTGKPQRIGRESSNDVVVPDINVSRVHAEIRRESTGTWVISDLGSTNGLFVNNRQVKTAPLRDADIILLGTTELEFQLLS
ncbi:DUF3662 and FHA domain-containing protein [Adlercreutzia sp. ZJ304]|uniref:FhaA domain-containing protein n=1 Tax=Adlercreutzia sp. ZJ304 TaxID=2709791 RepID=UPI0013EB37E8|nr:DUF3662 and FHA domain-containing protein [Adlercreutzia sp. ZJ304]